MKEGSIGAGAGATVGKFGGAGRAMKGGVGTASLSATGGLIVGALVVVNAAGSVIDPRTGKPVAGVRSADGKSLEDPFALVRRGTAPTGTGENTTIGVIATNARLTKAQAHRVVTMAHDGLARAIVPAHTMSDGDTLFALATGTVDAEVNRVGVLAAEAVSDAILRAVRAAVLRTGATVLLKGATQLVAAPDQTWIDVALHGPAWTAQAGSGDVLGGICAALLAAGLPAARAAGVAASLQALAAARHPGPIPPQRLAELASAEIARLQARRAAELDEIRRSDW